MIEYPSEIVSSYNEWLNLAQCNSIRDDCIELESFLGSIHRYNDDIINTIMRNATRDGYLGVVKYLVEYAWADVKVNDGELLKLAKDAGQIHIVEYLDKIQRSRTLREIANNLGQYSKVECSAINYSIDSGDEPRAWQIALGAICWLNYSMDGLDKFKVWERAGGVGVRCMNDYINAVECQFYKGSMHGKYVQYYNTRAHNKYIECTYKYNKLNGAYAQYHINGNICVISFYDDGLLHGEYISYTPNGTIITKKYYEHGNIVDAC